MDYTNLKECAKEILKLIEKVEATEQQKVAVHEEYKKAEANLNSVLDESFTKFKDFSKKKEHAERQLRKRMHKKVTLSDELTLAIANSSDEKVIEELEQRIKNNNVRIKNLENAKAEAELRTDNTKPYFFASADRKKLREAIDKYDSINADKSRNALLNIGMELVELAEDLRRTGTSLSNVNNSNISYNRKSEEILKQSDFYEHLITDEQRRYFNGYFREGQLTRLLRIVPDDMSVVEFAEKEILKDKQEESNRDNKAPLTITTREF